MVDTGSLSAGEHTAALTITAKEGSTAKQGRVRVVVLEPSGPGQITALKFEKLEFLRPEDWERTLKAGCVVYTNISAGPSPIRVTLPDGSTQEFEIPADHEVIVCGDVVYIDTGRQ
jgi:hypothetical protein